MSFGFSVRLSGRDACDISSQGGEFFNEVFVSAVEKMHAGDMADIRSEKGSQYISKTCSEIWNDDVFGQKRCGAFDDDAMEIIERGKAARLIAEALREGFDVCAHELECFRIAKAIFINRFVHYRGSLALREEHDKGLLPIGQKAWVYICL